MKPSNEAPVRTRMFAVGAAAALMLAAAAAAAHAVSPIVKLDAMVQLSNVPAARDARAVKSAKLHMDVRFGTDTPGAALLTLQQADLRFPDREGTNGALFPSCGVQQIARFHGDLARCPKGSRIGGGTVEAQISSLGITVTGRVAMFNSHRGKSITFNVQASVPAQINESFDAPLVRHRRDERLTLRVPPTLQQPLPGIFVGVQDFDVTVGATARVHGVTYSFFKARECPNPAIHGSFGFVDPATGRTAGATTATHIRCRLR